MFVNDCLIFHQLIFVTCCTNKRQTTDEFDDIIDMDMESLNIIEISAKILLQEIIHRVVYSTNKIQATWCI